MATVGIPPSEVIIPMVEAVPVMDTGALTDTRTAIPTARWDSPCHAWEAEAPGRVAPGTVVHSIGVTGLGAMVHEIGLGGVMAPVAGLVAEVDPRRDLPTCGMT